MTVHRVANFFLFGTFFFLFSCSKEPKFSFFCEKDKLGNYTLKWEVVSQHENKKIGVYMSDNDSIFADPPLLRPDIKEYVAIIATNDSIGRKFFRLKVNRTFSDIISNRFFKMDSLQNFRDMGGYATSDKKQMKWGMLYRSGELSDVSPRDVKVLDALNIASIVDFRDDGEKASYTHSYQVHNLFQVPIVTNSRAYVTEKIIDGSFLRDDAIIFTKESYRSMIENNTKDFARFFDILCDESNYPILLHAYLGKDRVGLASYFILKILGVPEDIINDDYLASNSCISEQYAIGEARFLPEKMQEAATVVCKADIVYLNYAKSYMENKSGSVDLYLEKELGLTPDKKEKLREILLYN